MALRSSYTDLLEREDSTAYVAAVQALEIGYALAEPPAWLWKQVPRGVPGGAWVAATPPSSRVRKRAIRWTRYVAALAVAVSVLVSYTVWATGNSTVGNLGKPTNDAPPSLYVPLSGFRHVRSPLPATRPPELLWLGSEDDVPSAAERWPLVKALEQFGSFSGLSASQTPDCDPPSPSPYACHIPTFDWNHASYHSRYVTFAHRELFNQAGKLYQHLSSAELKVFDRYLGAPGEPFAAAAQAVLKNTRVGESLYPTTHDFPLILIGDYLQTGTSALPYGDFGYGAPYGADFNDDQTALQHAQPSTKVSSTLIHDVNAEANLITALICHADRLQPRSVCSRGVIKQLLRYTR